MLLRGGGASYPMLPYARATKGGGTGLSQEGRQYHHSRLLMPLLCYRLVKRVDTIQNGQP